MVKRKKPIQNKNANRKKTSGYKNKLSKIVEHSLDKSTSTELGNARAEISLPPTQKYSAPSQNKSKRLPAPDISSILKEGADAFQDFDLDEFSDTPFHSTAVAADGEEQLENALPPEHGKSTRSQKVSPPKKRLEKRKILCNTDTPDCEEKKSRTDARKGNLKEDTARKTPKKASTNVQASEPSSTLKSVRNTPKSTQLQTADHISQDEGVLHTSGAAVQGSKDSASPNSEILLPTPAESLSSEATRLHQSSKSSSSAEKVLPQAKDTLTPKKTSMNVLASEPSSTLKSVRKTQKSKQLENTDHVSQGEGVLHTSGSLHTFRADVQSSEANTSQSPAELSSEATGVQQLSKRSLSIEAAQHQEKETVETSLHNKKDKSKGEKKKLPINDSSPSDQKEAEGSNASVKIWCPDGMKRSSRDLTELDIVLAEFENIITDYKQNVESDVCMKAIDLFFSSFKEQVTETKLHSGQITDSVSTEVERCVNTTNWWMYGEWLIWIEEVQKLKDMKRKNAKVNNEIAKKRRRLVEVKGEHVITEPQVKQLQREYAQLKVKKSSLKSATQFLSDLKELQKWYMVYRKKNPKEKEEYDITSLPALLWESRSIVAPEKHFQIINSKLQHFLDQENEQDTQ